MTRQRLLQGGRGMRSYLTALLAILGIVISSSGVVVLTAGSASAHTPNFSATCNGYRLWGTSYDTKQGNARPNSYELKANGQVIESGTFGNGFDTGTKAVPQGGAVTLYEWKITAWNDVDGRNGWTKSGSAKIGPCGQKPPLVETKTENRSSCEAGYQERTATITKDYVWNGVAWVVEPSSGWTTTYTPWVKKRDLTGAEKKALGCYGTQPQNKVVVDDTSKQDCSGYYERRVTTTKEYVLTDNGWVLEAEKDWTVVDTGWVKKRDLTNAEKKTLGCYGDQPGNKVVVDKDDKKDCSGYFEKTVTTTKEYVLTDDGWVLEPAKDWTVVDTGWVKQRDLTGAEKKALGCYGDQPDDKVVVVGDDKLDCSGYYERKVTTTKEYVLTDNGWVLEAEKDWTVVDTGWVKKRELTGAEKKAEGCYGDEPDALVTQTGDDRSSCDLGVQRRTVTTTKEFVLTDSGWVLEPEADWTVVDTGWVKQRDLTGAEKRQLGCYGTEPGDLVERTSDERATCVGVEQRTVTTTKEYVLTDGGWVVEPQADWTVVDSGWVKVRDLTAQEAVALGCVKGVEEIAPVVSFTDPTCDDLDGAGWSAPLTDLVDYTVEGDVAPGEAVVVTATIKPSVAGQYAFASGHDTTAWHKFPSVGSLGCEEILGEEETKGPKPDAEPVVQGTASAVPTAVAAGLGDEVGVAAPAQHGPIGAALLVSGLGLLVAAGGLLAGRRSAGMREA